MAVSAQVFGQTSGVKVRFNYHLGLECKLYSQEKGAEKEKKLHIVACR